MFETSTNLRRLIAVVAASTIGVACSKKPASEGTEQTSAGAIDSSVLKTGSVSPAVGPAVQVTRTDSKSIDKAMKYELTPLNFMQFLAAADSISALEGRDAASRAYLANNLTDAGSTDADAGLKWLEANDSVSATIQRAGISVRDYFVESLAIAAASRFIDDPKAAPPTPTLASNAKFLAGHKADLARLQTLRDNKPGMTVTP